MDFVLSSLGTALHEVYQRLLDCHFGLEDPELAMFNIALLIAMAREGPWDHLMELMLMLANGESGTAGRDRKSIMRWRRGKISGHDMAREPRLGEQRDYRLGESEFAGKLLQSPIPHSSSSLVLPLDFTVCLWI